MKKSVFRLLGLLFVVPLGMSNSPLPRYVYDEAYTDFTYSFSLVHEDEDTYFYDLQITNTGDSFINTINNSSTSLDSYFEGTLIEPGSTKTYTYTLSKRSKMDISEIDIRATCLITKDESINVTGSLAVSSKYTIDYAFESEDKYLYPVIELEYAGKTYFVYNKPNYHSADKLYAAKTVQPSDVTIKSITAYRYGYVEHHSSFGDSLETFGKFMLIVFLVFCGTVVVAMIIVGIAVPTTIVRRRRIRRENAEIEKKQRENAQK